jgi:PilZ domain
MSSETTPRQWFAARGDRRRIPRYFCSGVAQINCLPLSGSLLRGRVRDLGLGGCCIECIETGPLLDPGDRTEVLVEVNSWFFRAMAQVKAIRGRSGISMEFIRMSAGGSSMLADLIADLERPRTVGSRQERLVEHSRRLLQGNSGLGSGLSSELSSARPNSTAVVGTIMSAHSAANRHAWLRDLPPTTNSVNIFV